MDCQNVFLMIAVFIKIIIMVAAVL
ncbi:hypothetical protein DERP_008637 [Dermatophagoides pteronyssinus]|uniref:Uncharacterized protein n=1 Tax=Dermatophagoides pteronyssinus TaxID=6956 RepID=A0ABQ8IWU2_DERPT|nr:hypothetical protein DERP_008637 [Dermatophagoides pteronyssinus]